MEGLYNIDLSDTIPAIVLGVVKAAKSQRVPRNTSVPGGVYLQDLLESSERRVYDVLRMKRETFLELCNWLKTRGGLITDRKVSVEMQVAMFLWTLNYSASVRQVEERFQISTETIHQ
jgi:hypothetical protein